MRHARPADLAASGELLGLLRAIEGLRERTPGSFYRGGSGFLHIHVDGDRLFADVKLDGAWEQMPASMPAQRRRLVAVARKAAAS